MLRSSVLWQPSCLFCTVPSEPCLPPGQPWRSKTLLDASNLRHTNGLTCVFDFEPGPASLCRPVQDSAGLGPLPGHRQAGDRRIFGQYGRSVTLETGGQRRSCRCYPDRWPDEVIGLKGAADRVRYYTARPSQAIHEIPDPYPELKGPPPRTGKLAALPLYGGVLRDYGRAA